MLAKRQQSGFALLIFLIILIGMGAFVVEGYVQNIAKDIELNKYQKNQYVLQQAKSALLQYVYTYPQFNADAPGRLPCPYDRESSYSGTLSSAICNAVGRFPRNNADLNFYDAKDASNEYLWYAVSENFYNFNPGGSSVINSDTTGTITLVDQSGSILYNGSIAGIAAIIIAPGAALNRDENNDGVYEYNQVRTTATERINPRNYMDTFNGFDNSVFVNSSAAVADGFILGPVKDLVQNSVVVNDQMIVVTAAEVLGMAEKAVLEEYKKAIVDYRSKVPGGGYPWLFDYATTNLDSFNSGLTNIGRIPSIFANYFSDNKSEPIHSQLRFSVTKNFELSGVARNLSYNLQSASVLSDVEFDDLGNDADNLGQLTAGGAVEIQESIKYFRDDLASPSGWVPCGDDGDGIAELTDCNRDGSGAPTPGVGSNGKSSKILKVGIRLDYNSGVVFDLNYSGPVNTQYLAATAFPSTNAEILQEFTSDKVTALPVLLYYNQFDYAVGGAITNIVNGTPQEVNDNTNLGELINQTTSNIKIGLRYYPVLPAWAKTSENDWHNSIMMAISSGYQPGAALSCTAGANCLIVSDMGGVTDNKIALLLMAGSSTLVDNSSANFTDDLDQIFDPGNFDILAADPLGRTFFKRTGDDTILILQEQP